jgi:hypothetical protein
VDSRHGISGPLDAIWLELNEIDSTRNLENARRTCRGLGAPLLLFEFLLQGVFDQRAEDAV